MPVNYTLMIMESFMLCVFFLLLFLAVLGLRGRAWAFSSCGELGLLSSRGVWASRYSGLSCWALGHRRQ